MQGVRAAGIRKGGSAGWTVGPDGRSVQQIAAANFRLYSQLFKLHSNMDWEGIVALDAETRAALESVGQWPKWAPRCVYSAHQCVRV